MTVAQWVLALAVSLAQTALKGLHRSAPCPSSSAAHLCVKFLRQRRAIRCLNIPWLSALARCHCVGWRRLAVVWSFSERERCCWNSFPRCSGHFRWTVLTPGNSKVLALSPSPWVGISHCQWFMASFFSILKWVTNGRVNSPSWHSSKKCQAVCSHVWPVKKTACLTFYFYWPMMRLLSNFLPW